MTPDEREWIHETAKAAAWKDGLDGLHFEDNPDDNRDMRRERHVEEAHEQNDAAKRYSLEQQGCLTLTTIKERGTRGDKEREIVKTQLCNFDAWIEGERIIDDGLEQILNVSIAGRLIDGTPLPTLDVPSADFFTSMVWVSQWGGRAVVHAGPLFKEHIRTAIQYLSPAYDTKTVYGHIGWRNVGEQWVYLHAGGAIGSKGLDTSVNVELNGKLQYYDLPKPSEGEELKKDISLLLNLLTGIDDTLGYVSLGFTYRPIFNEKRHAACTDYILGGHSIFKTAMCAVWQACYGAGFKSDTLPIGWESTTKAIERTANITKDALLTIDDFKPAQSSGEQRELYNKADALIRGNANAQARQRLKQDAREGLNYPPKAGLRSSGEIPPVGQSLRGRMCLRKCKKGDISKTWLDAAQRDAATGAYARVTSAFLKWLAPRYDSLDIDTYEDYWRDRLGCEIGVDSYARTPSNLAECYTGFTRLIGFAMNIGAINEDLAKKLNKKCWAALLKIGSAQLSYITQEEPTELFFEMLKGALRSGAAYIGGSSEMISDATLGSGGVCIGYSDGKKVWLKGAVAYKVAFEFASRSGISLGKEGDIWSSLADKGIITSEGGEDGKPRRYSILKRFNDEDSQNAIRVREMKLSCLYDGTLPKEDFNLNL